MPWSSDELADRKCGDVRGAGGRTLAPWLRVVCALSARAPHGRWQRQEGRLAAQVTARIRGGGPRRTGGQGRVREEGGAVPTAGLGAELRGSGRRTAWRAVMWRGAGVHPQSGWGRGSQGAFKGEAKPKWRSPGGPRTREACGGHGVRNSARPMRVFPGTPRPKAPESFLLRAKKHHHQQQQEEIQGWGGNKTPGTPAPRARGAHQGARLGGRDPAAHTPAPAGAEKFARLRAARALGRPAPGSESARGRHRVALAGPERRGERASARPPAGVRPELARGRGGASAGRRVLSDRRAPLPPPPPSRPRAPSPRLPPPKSKVWAVAEPIRRAARAGALRPRARA